MKYKKLVGGGLIKIVNSVVPVGLLRLGYNEQQASEITRHIDERGTIEGAPRLKPEHLPVFDCALKPASGKRLIHHLGHLRMMAAVQPFLSGAISKTVNLPEEATVEDIAAVYLEAWRLGLKAIAIYRDGSKRTQPLNAAKTKKESKVAEAVVAQEIAKPFRRRLPDERQAITHHFSVGGQEGYLTVGLYGNGVPGEIFITMAKEGSTVSGLMDCFATAVSLALQYGVPLKVLCEKFSHTRFEPSGWSGNQEIGYAKSLMDYMFRWLAAKFLPTEVRPFESASITDGAGVTSLAPVRSGLAAIGQNGDAPACQTCGAIMVRNGACYHCMNCGSTSGCS